MRWLVWFAATLAKGALQWNVLPLHAALGQEAWLAQGVQELQREIWRTQFRSPHVSGLGGTTDIAVQRQLRASGSARARAGGPRGSSGKEPTGFGLGAYVFFFCAAVLLVLTAFCCFGRHWRAYLNDGGSMSSFLRMVCLMCGYGCGVHSSRAHPCGSWFCVWVFRHCCKRDRYRTAPELTLPRASREDGGAELGEWARRQSQRAAVTGRATGSEEFVLKRDLLAAQARTVVAPYEQPKRGRASESVMTECIICLDPFEPGDPLRTLPCMHRYHKACIDQWLSSHLSCPICKSSVGIKRAATMQT